jgi:hypothetical protein
MFPQVAPFYEPGSIPGSSTENKLVKAKSLGQLLFRAITVPRARRSWLGRDVTGVQQLNHDDAI